MEKIKGAEIKTNGNIDITSAAAQKLRELMTKQNLEGKSLRIFVKPGGCRGFNYGMGFDAQRNDDITTEVSSMKVIIDPMSFDYLEGVTIDFKDAMMGGGFTITNPNATSTCGCGQSFKAKGETGQPTNCCGS